MFYYFFYFYFYINLIILIYFVYIYYFYNLYNILDKCIAAAIKPGIFSQGVLYKARVSTK